MISDKEKHLIERAESLWGDAASEEAQRNAVALYHLAHEVYRTPLASYRLGCAYMSARGVPRNPQVAAVLLKDACDADMRSALYYRGRALADAANPDMDLAAARADLERSSAMGLTQATDFITKFKWDEAITPPAAPAPASLSVAANAAAGTPSDPNDDGVTLPLPDGRRRARPLGRNTISEGPIVEYVAALPEGFCVRKIRLRLSGPEVPRELRSSYFAEHVSDPATGLPGRTVIIGGAGRIGVSDDLGKTWRSIEVPDSNGNLMWNCFTTSTGRHIVQAAGWRDQLAGTERPGVDARIHLFDNQWRYAGSTTAGSADWHGSASIGQSGNTIMFAEYFDNALGYRADFAERRSELEPRLRPNAIWRSRDDGETWEKVFEKGPFEVRHFHTVQPDPVAPRTWWASSGDRWYECRVWRSDDDGDNWTDVTNPEPDIVLPLGSAKERAACHRFTDAIIGAQSLLWGSDDMLGRHDQYDVRRPLAERSGARLYRTPKTEPLQPREIAYVGQTVRKLIDIGPGWLVLGEGKYQSLGFDVQVSYLEKDTDKLALLFELPPLDGKGTGLSYSRGSRALCDGTAFTMKRLSDVVRSSACILKWEVETG